MVAPHQAGVKNYISNECSVLNAVYLVAIDDRRQEAHIYQNQQTNQQTRGTIGPAAYFEAGLSPQRSYARRAQPRNSLSKFDRNVTVTGGVISIINGFGDQTPLVGNLTITGSAGNSGIYCPNTTNVIRGNLTFTGNTGNLYVCQATVGGNVTVSNNNRINTDYSGWWTAALYGITAGKNLTCEGNNPGPIGSGNTAKQLVDQCAGLN